MDQEVNLSIKLGELSLSSDISATFVINGPDQVVTGIKEFEDGIDIGDNNSSLGHGCLAVGNELSVGSYNFFYKGIQLDKGNLSAKIYLTSKQPRYPYPFVTTIEDGDLKFKLQQNTVDLNNWDSTWKYLSSATNSKLSNNLSSAFFCINNDIPWHRNDYNQLCIDIGEGYWKNMNEVRAKISQYLVDAMTPEHELSVFNLENGLSAGDSITIVNNDKITSHRCATLKQTTDNGCVLEVQLNSKMRNYLRDYGIMFPDFDFDDYAVIFADRPILSGPANTSTYSSINIGAENKCLRRCSMAVGKQNTAEADFSIALGRKAQANHYCSFVWGPAVDYVKSPTNYTFTIGQKGRLSDLIKPTVPSSAQRTIYVANQFGESQELHKFVLSCVAEDTSLVSYLMPKLSNQKFTKVQVGSGVATANGSIAVGTANTTAKNTGSMALGDSVSALQNCSLAVGTNTSTGGWYSIAVGNGSKTNNSCCASFGTNVSAYGQYSFAIGTNSYAKDNRSFVWNSSTSRYDSNGENTFNLNPSTGLNGFFIGKDNFIQCVLSAVSKMDETQLNTLKGILGIS